MDTLKLSRIDEELESSEVAALCFLCSDVVKRKRLEGVRDAKDLFLRLEEHSMLENHVFLSQLLKTIHRADLLSLLETDSRQTEETDASRPLSDYRVMLYNIYDDMTQENFERMKFLLNNKLAKRTIEACNTALDLFSEMEKASLLSSTNLTELHIVLQEFDQQLALTVQRYIDGITQQERTRLIPSVMDDERVNYGQMQPNLSISESQSSNETMESIYSDAHLHNESHFCADETEYYALHHNPRGLCVVFNNEMFKVMSPRRGTLQDVYELKSVFTLLGFKIVVHDNLTADSMRHELKMLGEKTFSNHDALVVCVLSHGDNGCVYGTDENKVLLRELTQPFTSRRAPTLAGKPKLFFIQACQGSDLQQGCLPYLLYPTEEKGNTQNLLEEDAGHVPAETIPVDADFLLGMATVPDYKSFRNTTTGSIYIQELCKQLKKSAESSQKDDILSVLTRVNREVSKGVYLSHKQMPEPKYTLTKKLVLTFV